MRINSRHHEVKSFLSTNQGLRLFWNHNVHYSIQNNLTPNIAAELVQFRRSGVKISTRKPATLAQVSRGLPQSLKENLVHLQLGQDGIIVQSFPFIGSPSHHITLLRASLNQEYILETIQTEIYRQLHWLAVIGFFNRTCCKFVSPGQLIISNHRPRWTTMNRPFHHETKTV